MQEGAKLFFVSFRSGQIQQTVLPDDDLLLPATRVLDDIEVVVGRYSDLALCVDQREPSILTQRGPLLASSRHGNNREIEILVVDKEGIRIKIERLRLNDRPEAVLDIVHLDRTGRRHIRCAENVLIGQGQTWRNQKAGAPRAHATAGTDQDAAHPFRCIQSALEEFNR